MLFAFHDGRMNNNDMHALDRNHQWPPVATVPYSWHKICEHLDQGGTMPDAVTTDNPTNPTPNYYDINSFNPFGQQVGGATAYLFGWNAYFGDWQRWMDPCSPGGVPYL